MKATALSVTTIIIAALSAPSQLWAANSYDPSPAWPLCGRISENPPSGWSEQLGCPAARWGSRSYSDYPLSSSFGPRRKASESYRYDFHRGVDIPTATGTPVFAITDGVVRIAGANASYTDPLVQLRHYPPGTSSCLPDGCYVSNYMHLSSWLVGVGQNVIKGQLIGYSGVGESGFAHLHFEVRNARAADPYSSWQRDAVHPLRVLPYADGSTPTWNLSMLSSAKLSASSARLQVSFRQASSLKRLDLVRIEVEPLTSQGVIIAQAGNSANADGYHVRPTFFDFELMNIEYTHKNTAKNPWSSYVSCPYSAEHPGSYDPSIHMDKQAVDNISVHEFNGARIDPAAFNVSSEVYQLDAKFILTNVAPDNYCANIKAYSAQGIVVTKKICIMKGSKGS